MVATTTSPRFTPSPWNKVVDLYVLTVLFCALMAAILTLANPSLSGFMRWLLIIECIGLAATTTGTALSRVPWLQRHRPVIAHFYISIVAIPIGYVAGSSLAYSLLGEPIPFFSGGSRRVVALVATALASLFIVYLDSMRQRIAAEAAARSEAQRLAMESQLRLLRAQLEPHMLFNTLANLRSLVDGEPKLAQAMIDQLIVYLRSTLAASREESTTLRNEFAQLRAYLEIMSLRMGPRLKFRLELPDNLQQAAIPPMLLQPLVENAIKHGIEPKIGNGEIEVRASRVDGALEISITDSGLGLPADAEDEPPMLQRHDAGHGNGNGAAGNGNGAPGNGTAKHASSYGLVHVRERLRAFYGPQATLTLTRHEPYGVRAIVRIPR